jgi:hypothetical protein
MYGPGTKVYAKASQARQNKVFNRMKKKGSVDSRPTKRAKKAATFLAAVTKELHYLEPDDGSTGERRSRQSSWTALRILAEQAAKFVADWGNFKKPSATT